MCLTFLLYYPQMDLPAALSELYETEYFEFLNTFEYVFCMHNQY